MIDGEGGKFARTIQQPSDRLGHVRQIGPLMPGMRCGGVLDAAHRFARPHQHLRKPVVLCIRPEKVPGADDQHRYAAHRCHLQPPLHLHAKRALAGERLLRAVLLQQRKGIRPEIIDSARKEDPCSAGFGGGDGVVEHGQHLPLPIAIAGRIDGVDDERGAFRGVHHILPVHHVAGHALDAIRRAGRHTLTRQRPHLPAALQQHLQDVAADTAIGAQDQGQRPIILCRICMVFIYHRSYSFF